MNDAERSSKTESEEIWSANVFLRNIRDRAYPLMFWMNLDSHPHGGKLVISNSHRLRSKIVIGIMWLSFSAGVSFAIPEPPNEHLETLAASDSVDDKVELLLHIHVNLETKKDLWLREQLVRLALDSSLDVRVEASLTVGEVAGALPQTLLAWLTEHYNSKLDQILDLPAEKRITDLQKEKIGAIFALQGIYRVSPQIAARELLEFERGLFFASIALAIHLMNNGEMEIATTSYFLFRIHFLENALRCAQLLIREHDSISQEAFLRLFYGLISSYSTDNPESGAFLFDYIKSSELKKIVKDKIGISVTDPKFTDIYELRSAARLMLTQ